MAPACSRSLPPGARRGSPAGQPPRVLSIVTLVLSLTADSPAVDAGFDTYSNSYPGILVYDVMRLDRPIGSLDIGAHEYQGD